MKEKLLHFASYVLVAALATVTTLVMVQLEIGLKPSKLNELEDLIEEGVLTEEECAALTEKNARRFFGI